MEILLEELYKIDLTASHYVQRKLQLDSQSYQINGIAQSGKTELVKAYLLTRKKSSYLYIDADDVRIEVDELNEKLQNFCTSNKIDILVLDNYHPEIKIINVSQLIVCSRRHYELDFLISKTLYPLDYEEFLAFESRYDSTAVSHYLQIGGFAAMHRISTDNRAKYIQEKFRYALSALEFDILLTAARFAGQKLSAFNVYEKLKLKRKISKDMLYRSFETMTTDGYIHQLSKLAHPKATKKIYLCDIVFKHTITIQKNFARIFENMVFLEMFKNETECFYDEGVDFYIPKRSEIILCMPFADERTLFKKLESIEAFIFSNQVQKITCVTMSKEGTISHPMSQVEIIPFAEWALSD
ncbi:ATP-binding protein [Sulfurimonas sp. HSL-1716]|uniref:ATP-binding protein n=1 Tax=Hydrocurvibacter sulfurireducens TaxID=3131937 RepID=UPI0031F9D006